MSLRASLISMTLILFALAACQNAPASSLVPSTEETPDLVVNIERGTTERVPAELSNPVLDNCGGSGDLSRTISRGRSTTVVMELTISTQFEAEIPTIKAQLGAAFSVQEGETISADDEVSVTISPGSRVRYEVQWYETWDTGNIVITDLNVTIPYRVRRGFDADIVSSEREQCAGSTSTMAPTATPSPLPTSTPMPVTPSTKQPTSVPAATNTQVVPSQSVSCEATINRAGSDATRLQIVYSQPPPGGIPLAPLHVNTRLQAVNRRDTPSNGTWFQVAQQSGTLLGWVHIEDLLLSVNCP